nr:transposase [Enterococcus sp. BWB1-3]
MKSVRIKVDQNQPKGVFQDVSIRAYQRFPYSNGPLECLNNHSKVLKRMTYGFHNFTNFRERIFLYRRTYFLKKKPKATLKKQAG